MCPLPITKLRLHGNTENGGKSSARDHYFLEAIQGPFGSMASRGGRISSRSSLIFAGGHNHKQQNTEDESLDVVMEEAHDSFRVVCFDVHHTQNNKHICTLYRSKYNFCREHCLFDDWMSFSSFGRSRSKDGRTEKLRRHKKNKASDDDDIQRIVERRRRVLV